MTIRGSEALCNNKNETKRNNLYARSSKRKAFAYFFNKN